MCRQKYNSDGPISDQPSVAANRANILLGVTGGIAAYKAVDLASKLTASGMKVRTVMTGSAQRFVTAKSFETVTNSPVFTDLWTAPQEIHTAHISFLDWADIVVIAPATANIIAKMACGVCDDLLSTTLCACWSKPMLFAPAMNNNMWENPAVQRNVEQLRKAGVELIGPAVGRLACGTKAIGRLSEPQDILKAIEKIVERIKPQK